MMTAVKTPDAVFAELHRAVGGRLFTVTVLDSADGLARRACTSHPVEYPVSGTKPLRDDRRSMQLLLRGERFVANTLAEFADVFLATRRLPRLVANRQWTSSSFTAAWCVAL
jgi:hypothetical protein